MPSYTFVSTADAFVLRGATAVFVDIRPDTMNIDENLIEQAITEKTKAIVPVHYAGVACEMDRILEIANQINEDRMRSWNQYYAGLKPLVDSGYLDLPHVPDECQHNAHMFYIKAKDLEERTRLIEYLKNQGIMAPFHYVSLHNAPAGRQFGRFSGEDIYTTKESERLLRLPLYYGIGAQNVNRVIETVSSFYKGACQKYVLYAG